MIKLFAKIKFLIPFLFICNGVIAQSDFQGIITYKDEFITEEEGKEKTLLLYVKENKVLAYDTNNKFSIQINPEDDCVYFYHGTRRGVKIQLTEYIEASEKGRDLFASMYGEYYRFSYLKRRTRWERYHPTQTYCSIKGYKAQKYKLTTDENSRHEIWISEKEFISGKTLDAYKAIFNSPGFVLKRLVEDFKTLKSSETIAVNFKDSILSDEIFAIPPKMKFEVGRYKMPKPKSRKNDNIQHISPKGDWTY